jgi:Ca2+-binding EF-hand superfamily protein
MNYRGKKLYSGDFKNQKFPIEIFCKTILVSAFVFNIGCGSSSTNDAQGYTWTDSYAISSDAERATFRESYADLFNAMDFNSDGVVSKEEFLDLMVQKFQEKDQNNDRVLEQSDFTEEENTFFVIPYDQDGDGIATKEEYLAYYTKIFNESLDKNSSGSFTLEDFLEIFGL